MHESERAKQVYHTLCGAYNRAMLPGAEGAWAAILRDVPEQFFVSALRESSNEWPERMPTAGQFKNLCMRIAQRERARDAPEPKVLERELPPLPKDNPFQRLAEQFEAETYELGLMPSSETPAHVAQRRLSDLAALIKRHFGTK